MTEPRTQNTEHRRTKTEPRAPSKLPAGRQNPEPRQKNTDSFSSVCVLCSVFCVLYFVLWVLSSAMAASWSPKDVLKKYLTDNYPWAQIEITNLRLSSDISGKAPERIVVKKGPIGKAVFSLEFKTGKTLTIKADVRALDWVVKSRRPFKKGHVIRKDDIYLSTMDVTKMPGSAIKNPKAVIGEPLKRSIIANAPIVEHIVDKSLSLMVKRGRRVILIIESQGLRITALGKTKEKGYIGMPVKAVNLLSKKEVGGVLIDENTVKVGF